jgi:manganese/zinc/iron transport system ATP- binding protein
MNEETEATEATGKIVRSFTATCETSKRADNLQEHLQRLDIAIHIEDLTVAYDKEPALWDIDMEIPKGILLAVVGPSGAGKTTLLKAIVGLANPSAGHISLYGKPADKQRKIVAYVPSKTSVDWDFPLTIYETVLMGTYVDLGWFKRPNRESKAKTLDALGKVGMLEFKDKQIGELTGGQRQRVFLARALVQNASIYLMDEPFRGLDQPTEALFNETLQQLRDSGKTVLVTHNDVQTVKDYFDWALLINSRSIALGAMKTVLTKKNIRRAYEAKCGLLAQEPQTHTEAQ